jgi:hypothetical protein
VTDVALVSPTSERDEDAEASGALSLSLSLSFFLFGIDPVPSYVNDS